MAAPTEATAKDEIGDALAPVVMLLDCTTTVDQLKLWHGMSELFMLLFLFFVGDGEEDFLSTDRLQTEDETFAREALTRDCSSGGRPRPLEL